MIGKRIIIDIIERLVREIEEKSGKFKYYVDDDYIEWVKGIIGRLEEEEGEEVVKMRVKRHLNNDIEWTERHGRAIEHINKKLDKLIEMVTKDKVNVTQSLLEDME